MRKKILPLALALAICLGLTACGHTHTWQEADCTTPRTCSECGETEGEALGHTWQEAACEKAKYCELCGKTEGAPLSHEWVEATYAAPKTCSLCGLTEGDPLPEPYYVKNDITFEKPQDIELPFAFVFFDGEKAVEIDGLWAETEKARYTFGEVTSEPSEREGYIDITVPCTIDLPITVYCDIARYDGEISWVYDAGSFSVGDCYTGLVVPERETLNSDALENEKDFEWDGKTYSIGLKKDINIDKSYSDWEQESSTVYRMAGHEVVTIVYTITIPAGYDGAVLSHTRNGTTEVTFTGEVDKTIEDKEEYFLDEHDADYYIFYRLSDLIQ